MPSYTVVWKPRIFGAISGVLATVVWWYLQKKPLIPNIHAGFHSFALWWYSTVGSIDGRDSNSRWPLLASMDSRAIKQRRGDFSPHGGIRGGGILLTDTEIRKSKPTDKAYRLSATLREQQAEATRLDVIIAANLKELGYGE
jgi:hypothetical protein